MKVFINVLLIIFMPSKVLAGVAEYENILITISDGWSINHSVIENEKGEKVGEFMPESAFEKDSPIKSGNNFILAIKNETDSESTFIESGRKGEVYWACASNEAFGDPSGPIVWFPRAFWNNGIILVLYSRKSCKDNFEQAMKIVKSMHAK